MSFWTNAIPDTADRFLNWISPPTTNQLTNQMNNESHFELTLFVRNHAYLILQPWISHSTMCYCMSRAIVIILCIEYYQLGKRFEKVIEQECHIGKVLEKFDFMRQITLKSREWANGLVTVNCMSVLTFLATMPQIIRHGIMKQNDNHLVIVHVSLFVFAKN